VEVGSVEIIAGTGLIIHQDLWGTINHELHEFTPELGDIMKELIIQRTPFLTGALQADMDFIPEQSTSTNELLWVFAQNIEQLLAWRRIYVAYQEGDPLGLPTFTNDPREMFFLTAQGDGLVATETWALYHVNIALGMCVMGVGVPF